jgi:hypothetical protein
MWNVWETEEVHTGFWVGGREGKRPLRRPRHRWQGNIKMGLQAVGCGGVDWIAVA